MTDERAEHEKHMRRCLQLAEVAVLQNNTGVGSVVVVGGEVVGEGIETLPTGKSLTGHAETIACQAAVDAVGKSALRGATIYSNAEPCFMCSYVIRQASFSLVVYGLKTPSIGGVSSSHPILTSEIEEWKPAPQVLGGILADECRMLRTKSLHRRRGS